MTFLRTSAMQYLMCIAFYKGSTQTKHACTCSLSYIKSMFIILFRGGVSVQYKINQKTIGGHYMVACVFIALN